MVIFGGAGDLAQRKLIPALYQLARDQLLPDGMALLSVGRGAEDGQAYRALLRESLARHARSGAVDERVWSALSSRIDWVKGDFDHASTYARLRERVESLERRRTTGGNRLFYLATAASAFPRILVGLSQARLLRRARSPWCRVAIEKPFGHDLESAQAIDRLASELLDEDQLFRVDHYLAKETVQNIFVLRFGNAIFEPLWNRAHVDHVQLTAAEALGLEGRGRFYDEAGVIRDMVQSHLLQVLSLVAAEAPVSFAARDIQDRKMEVLRAIRRPSIEDVVLGQYRGYLDEPGVARSSRTPTFVALRLLIDNWRWQGVPYYLRAGKRLRASVTEVDLQAQSVPVCMFAPEECDHVRPNVLRLRLQPDEGVRLRFVTKVLGSALSVVDTEMVFSYRSMAERARDAYERLVLDILCGDGTLFARRDVVERSWELLEPLLQARPPVFPYEPGSDGPAEADAMLARHGVRRVTQRA